MKRKWFLGFLSVFLWIAGPVAGVQGVDTAHFRALNLIRFPKPVALPDVSLPDLEADDVALSSFRGKVVLLNFWTTW